MPKTREIAVTYRIQDMEQTERPRERLARIGAEKLKTDELLAILLRTGLPGENAVEVGQRLIQECGGLTGLHRMPFEDLVAQHGLGIAKACQIKAALELGFRLKLEALGEKPAINSPEEAAEQVMDAMAGLEQEELWVILLDTRNRLQDIDHVYKGSLNSSTVRVGELFKKAIRQNIASVIVVHNHPSGDPSPSPEDIALTREVVRAGRLLSIEVLDHLVIGGRRFVSLKQRHLGFSE
jgi:DNA repair protein RadC